MRNKERRQIIFNKYDGKCAYCGVDLKKGWHVDELLPIRRNPDGSCLLPERIHIDNQMPSCPSCNISKHSNTLEEFRSLIIGFMRHLNDVNTQYKIAKRYGLVSEINKPVKFYFEKKN